MSKTEIDYEKILSSKVGEIRAENKHEIWWGDAIEAMKSAVAAALPVILDYVAKKGKIELQLHSIRQGRGVYTGGNIDKQSITSLAEDKDLKIKLGLDK